MKLTYQKLKSFSLLSMLLCVLSFLVVNYYPTGNFIGGPVIMLIIYIPLGLINIFIVGSIWAGKNNSLKYNQRIFLISVLISVLFIGILIYYMLGNQL